MKRGAPLRRKCSIRDGYLRKLREQGTRYVPKKVHAHGTWKVTVFTKRKPFKKITKSHRKKLRTYFAVSSDFLALPENEWCLICRKLAYEFPGRATEVHHFRGRIGRLLTDTRFFIPSCRAHRDFPHAEPALARSLGLLASPVEWNVYPGDPEDAKAAC